MLSTRWKDLLDMLLIKLNENFAEYFQPYLLNTLQLPEVIYRHSELLCLRYANLTIVRMTIHNQFQAE